MASAERKMQAYITQVNNKPTLTWTMMVIKLCSGDSRTE